MPGLLWHSVINSSKQCQTRVNGNKGFLALPEKTLQHFHGNMSKTGFSGRQSRDVPYFSGLIMRVNLLFQQRDKEITYQTFFQIKQIFFLSVRCLCLGIVFNMIRLLCCLSHTEFCVGYTYTHIFPWMKNCYVLYSTKRATAASQKAATMLFPVAPMKSFELLIPGRRPFGQSLQIICSE